MAEGISVKDLVKIYSNKVRALDGITFRASDKGIVTLVGPNGAGKTTLIKILTTILRPTSGVAYVKGYDVLREARRVRSIVSLVPQDSEPDRYLTAWEHVYYYLRARGFDENESAKLARNALEAVGLWDKRNILCARLSGGQRRRVLIATALAVPAEVYFLDEPTVGLDPLARRDVWSVLRDYAKDSLVFLTTHYMEEAEQLGEKILLINKGKLIAEGRPSDLIAKLGYTYKVIVESTDSTDSSLKSHLESFGNDVKLVKDNGKSIIYVKNSSLLRDVLNVLIDNKLLFTVRKVSLEDVFVWSIRGVQYGRH